MGGNMGRFQAAAAGSGLADSGPVAGRDGQPPPPAPVKEKKKQPIAKQMSSKISTASSKLTELMAWKAKVSECTALFLDGNCRLE